MRQAEGRPGALHRQPSVRAPEPALNLLPLLKRRIAASLFGRPTGITTSQDVARAHPGAWREAVPPDGRQRRPPIVFGGAGPDLFGPLPPIPALGTLAIADGLIAGSSGMVFTADRRFIADLSWYGAGASPSVLPASFKRTRHLAGTCLSLGSDFAANNYGHFLLDCLPRTALFLTAGHRFDEVDHVFLPKPPSKTASGLMEKLGIPLAKCVWASPDDHVTADRIIATSFPGTRRNYPTWLADYLRGVCKTPSSKSHGIYIPRDQVRKVKNEAELLGIAAQFGIDRYDFSKVADEAEYFHAARIVVGAHGAGMANLAFCAPGTKVLELIPSDHVHPYFYTLGESAGLDYACLVGESMGSRPKGTWGPSPFDFMVDPAVFRMALQALLS